ncbi:MAG: thiamine pyrophosphate-dependent dehydrogenase E1 component subunit alpha, partial [Spirochaetaceae bacterium]
MAEMTEKQKAQALKTAGSLSKEKLLDMYVKMNHIRAFEDKVAYFFSRGMVHGTTHLYSGEEATAVGALANLDDQDLMTSTHRGHGHTIGKGIDLKKMMAELLGKETGYCRGKGGSMHIADLTRGNLGANGIVGGGIPIATGAGITLKLRNEGRVVVCFFGDGALNEGTFHESVNMASIWGLPVIYICENNKYGMSFSASKSMNIDDLAVRAKAYGIPGVTVDGNDVFAVYEAVKKAKAHALKTGPYFIVSDTYRFMGHSKSDANKYRSKEEIAEWKERDPIPRMRSVMLETGQFTDTELDEVEEQCRQDIEEAVQFAESSADPSLDNILDDVYAPS